MSGERRWTYDGTGVIFDGEGRRVAYLHTEQAGTRGDEILRLIVEAVNEHRAIAERVRELERERNEVPEHWKATLAACEREATQIREALGLAPEAPWAQLLSTVLNVRAQLTAAQARIKEWED